MRNKGTISITINTELAYLNGGIYKAYVELNVYEDGVRTFSEPVIVLRGDDLPYGDALVQLGELTKSILLSQGAVDARIDELIAAIAKDSA